MLLDRFADLLGRVHDLVHHEIGLRGWRGADENRLIRQFHGCACHLRPLGHIISIGEAEGQPFKNIRERILPRSQTFTRLHLGHVDQSSPEWNAGVAHCLKGLSEGWLRVPIEGVFPIAQAADMHRRLEGRQVSGKLLLKTG